MIVEIVVKEHPLFQRDGQDLICDVPITYTQAVLGADIEIPSLDGKRKHHFYPGTQAGEIVRIRGGGMPDLRGTGAGDLLLRVILEVPKKVTAEQESLLRQLAELENTNVSAHRSGWFDRLKEWFVPSENEE